MKMANFLFCITSSLKCAARTSEHVIYADSQEEAVKLLDEYLDTDDYEIDSVEEVFNSW
jgi:hypothetical protein